MKRIALSLAFLFVCSAVAFTLGKQNQKEINQMLIKFSLKLFLAACLFSFLGLSTSAATIVVTHTADLDNTTGNCLTGGAL